MDHARVLLDLALYCTLTGVRHDRGAAREPVAAISGNTLGLKTKAATGGKLKPLAPQPPERLQQRTYVRRSCARCADRKPVGLLLRANTNRTREAELHCPL